MEWVQFLLQGDGQGDADGQQPDDDDDEDRLLPVNGLSCRKDDQNETVHCDDCQDERRHARAHTLRMWAIVAAIVRNSLVYVRMYR